MKKIIIFVLTLSLLLSTFSMSVSANEISNKDNHSLNKGTIEVNSDEPQPIDFEN